MHFGVIPYIVFDGDYLPSKAATEVERARKREESRKAGLEMYRLNKPSQAHLELQKAVDVNPEMARQLIEELKKIGVQYVVAPYEADAQLVYLERQGTTQGTLSEDSDLLVFGAKRLLTKLDQYGDCIEINRADFTACREISLVGWTDADFRRMAIMSGCDYLASINRMGLKSAYRLVRKYKTIEKIVRMLQFDGQYSVPTGYLEAFYKAELTFLHQRVFCPLKNEIVMMTEFESGAQPVDFSFIGEEVTRDVAIGVAKGDLDPMTKTPIIVADAVKTTPKAPWASTRRNAVDIFSNGKENKSIETFFKAKRTPLAELDPNSFTPSPTQQRLLQQANEVSWDSSPAPAGPPSLRSSVSLPSDPRPALSSLTNNSTALLSLAGPTHSKRRRLCPESNEKNEAAIEGTRSRFFTSNPPASTPTVKRRAGHGKTRTAEINIWSDDSVEDAMAALPDAMFEPAPSNKGKLEVFKDDQLSSKDVPSIALHADNSVQEESQTSSSSRATENLTSTTATSFTSSAESVTKTLGRHVTAELAELTQKYHYQPTSQYQTPNKAQLKDNQWPTAACIESHSTSKPLLRRQRSMTPLQRLGAGALNRSKSCSEGFSGGSSAMFESKNSKNSGNLSLNDNICAPNQHLPSPILRQDRRPTDPMNKGSEDAIIPDSDDEASDVVSESEEPAKPNINLGRFAFVG